MPPPPSQNIAMSNLDTKHRSSTPSTSSRGNVVDHDAPHGKPLIPHSICIPPCPMAVSFRPRAPALFLPRSHYLCLRPFGPPCLTILLQSPTTRAALGPARGRGQTESMSSRSNRSSAARCRYAVRSSIGVHGRSLLRDSDPLCVTARPPLQPSYAQDLGTSEVSMKCT